jgi:hypothetical protein
VGTVLHPPDIEDAGFLDKPESDPVVPSTGDTPPREFEPEGFRESVRVVRKRRRDELGDGCSDLMWQSIDGPNR